MVRKIVRQYCGDNKHVQPALTLPTKWESFRGSVLPVRCSCLTYDILASMIDQHKKIDAYNTDIYNLTKAEASLKKNSRLQLRYFITI